MNVIMRVGAPELTTHLALELEELALRINGRVFTRSAAEFDTMRALPHSNWDHKPLFVARVADAPDVADVVDFVRRHQLELAVRSGGHSVCGHSASADGAVIDLRDLNRIEIDLKTMTVWAGSGCTAGEVSRALDEHGVVVGFGDSGTVGIGGLTLGGGVGYMTRKHGLTIDALIAAEIVTASGDILYVDETHHPDLFWALRGGGGNFGVVTRFRYRLHPLPDFTGGPLVLPAEPEVLAGFVDAAMKAPDELTTILLAMPCPPFPFLPPELYGKTVLIGMMAYAGPMAEAQAALAPFRALATPIADLVRPGPYSMMYLPEDPTMRPALSVRTLFADGVGLAEAREILERLGRCDAPMHLAQIRVLGGAAARVANDATAFAHRQTPVLVGFLAMDGTMDAAIRNDMWAAECVAALGGVRHGNYVNFVSDGGPAAAQSAYPGATWDRLRAVKTRYDPHNMFRLNQNIPPA